MFSLSQLKDQSTKDSRWIQTVTRHLVKLCYILIVIDMPQVSPLLWIKTVCLITWKLYSTLKNLMQVLANTTIIRVKNSTMYELLIISSFNSLRWSFKSSWYLVLLPMVSQCMSAKQTSVSVLCAVRRRQRQIWGIVCPLQILQSPLSSRPQWESKVPNRFCRVFVLCWSPASVGWLITCSLLHTGWFITEMFGALPLIWPAS